MRVVVRVTLGVLTAVLGALLMLGVAASPATAATAPVTQHVAVVHPAAAPVTTTPSTDYNKAQQTANAALAKRKLILAGVCVVLLLIVWVGHRAKGKHILRLKNLQNAKS